MHLPNDHESPLVMTAEYSLHLNGGLKLSSSLVPKPMCKTAVPIQEVIYSE